MSDDIISRLNLDYLEIHKFLGDQSQVSFQADLERYFRKVFVLSIASQFETRIYKLLLDFTKKASNNSDEIVTLLKSMTDMKYHTFFDWGKKNKIDSPGKNANKFFAFFGDKFQREAEADVRRDVELDEAIQAFIELGHIRNILAHSNFAAYPFENKTIEEIMSLKAKAEKFLNYLHEKLLVQDRKVFPEYMI